MRLIDALNRWREDGVEEVKRHGETHPIDEVIALLGGNRWIANLTVQCPEDSWRIVDTEGRVIFEDDWGGWLWPA
ncbi:MAG: hypothetical protein C4523_15425 [Myxococcales bacterium]|nr:MAG: hypothetical protein C4523_15425 [Myxococcales bacterium]